MGKPLRILVVEDSEEDAFLLQRELRRGGFEVVSERVASAEAMAEALDRGPWDLVISDYVLPGFGGLEALALYHARGLDAPFLVVSGHIGEDIAVAAMKAGADDYLMKDRMARLVPAIERALSQADIRRAHRRSDEALRTSDERFRQLAENVGVAFFMFERPTDGGPGSLSYVSPAYRAIWGCGVETLFAEPDLWLKSIHSDDQARIRSELPRTFPVRNAEGVVYRVAALAEDISERKWGEERLAANARQLQHTVEELRIIEGELRASNEQLSQARAELEKRVQERTADLTAANAELQSQMKERKRLENELLEIAENERRRIGFDLHDDIGQKLMGVSLLIKALETNLSNKRAPEAAEIRKVQELLNQVVNHTHDLAHCFSSLDTNGADIGSMLKNLIATVRRTFPLTCRVQVASALPPMSHELVLQLYKIAQESISNAIKHAKPKKLSISLAHKQGQLTLQIKNDGTPFPTDCEPTNRLGLKIMNYRARTLGGTLDIRPNGDSGSVLTCTVPCNGNKITLVRFDSAVPQPANREAEPANAAG
jgi:signal transduction histidine kinase/CheY-like chemotaxis protein